MIIYKRNVTESDLKNSDEIIYYFDDYICYLITKVDNLFVVRRKKIYTDFEFWIKKVKTLQQVLKLIQ
ncbi:MAG: hypothetical protein PHN69_06670 [Candidatus Pacebacteria bacterium]|jgi:hypothetical protein|nr:hypothetical protein [Candidatus Paceibacterota bacterium]